MKELRDIPTKAREPRPTESALPLVHKLVQRRVLPMGHNMVWVDDDRSCIVAHERKRGDPVLPHVEDDTGFLWDRKFHHYADRDGRLWVARCPVSLDPEEKVRVMVDIPPGSIRTTLMARQAERLGNSYNRRRQEDGE